MHFVFTQKSMHRMVHHGWNDQLVTVLDDRCFSRTGQQPVTLHRSSSGAPRAGVRLGAFRRRDQAAQFLSKKFQALPEARSESWPDQTSETDVVAQTFAAPSAPGAAGPKPGHPRPDGPPRIVVHRMVSGFTTVQPVRCQ